MRSDYLDSIRSMIADILGREDEEMSARYMDCKRVLKEGIATIRSALHSEGFHNEVEEIKFYKEVVPMVWGQYFFYGRLIRIEARRKFEAATTFRALLQQELKKTASFFESYGKICAYYYERRTGDDARLFLRRVLNGPSGSMFLDRDLTIGAYWLTRMRLNELLRSWLTEELTHEEATPTNTIDYHGRTVELVELFKALHLVGWFGDASFKDVMHWAGTALGVKIGHFDVTLMQIRDRKITMTPFLDKLHEAMIGYINKRI